MLAREFQYYKDNQEKLVKKYKTSFLVIKGRRVLGSYNSHSEAYIKTIRTQKHGTFLIIYCLSAKETNSSNFSSHALMDSTKMCMISSEKSLHKEWENEDDDYWSSFLND